MDREHAFIAGATIGLTIAAPVGPMAVLCIRRTMNAGLHAGLSTGAGASTLHLTYAAIAVSGVDQLASWLRANHTVFHLASAAILLFFAFRCFRSRFMDGLPTARASSFRSVTRNYLSAMAFGAVNPMSLVLLIGAVAAFAGRDQSYTVDGAFLLGGVFAGSFGWWCVLVGTVAAIHARLNPGALRALNLVAGMGMAALAVVTCEQL